MKRRSIASLVMGACVVAVACVDLSAPAGPAAISELLLPATFVVRGDVMRDSLGNPAPARIVAFSQHGDTATMGGASFFITDSLRRAHIDSATHIIFGDSLGIAHVLGQTGNVQTSVFQLAVTVAPKAIQATPKADSDTVFVPIATDSVSSRSNPITIPLRVSGGSNAPSLAGADTAVQGVWVKYKLVDGPAFRDSVHHPAVFLINKAGDVSMLDTTGADGTTSNQVVVIGAFLDPSVVSDTSFAARHIVIQATAYYRSRPGSTGLQDKPLRLVLPLKPTFILK